MFHFAANLTMLFTELPFIGRFAAARNAGFRFVEFLFPYDQNPEEIKRELERNGLDQVLFNLPAGNWVAGERGIAALPNRITEFRDGVQQALHWARELRATQVNCLVGKRDEAYTAAEQRQVLVGNLRYAADLLEEHGIRLMVEPLNHYDVPGFLFNTSGQVLELLAEVNRPNVYLQYDLYHAKRENEDLPYVLRKHLPKIGHIQIADSPGRHQPGTGEIDYGFILREIEALGYGGYVAMEYVPTPDTVTSLAWVREYGFELG